MPNFSPPLLSIVQKRSTRLLPAPKITAQFLPLLHRSPFLARNLSHPCFFSFDSASAFRACSPARPLSRATRSRHSLLLLDPKPLASALLLERLARLLLQKPSLEHPLTTEEARSTNPTRTSSRVGTEGPPPLCDRTTLARLPLSRDQAPCSPPLFSAEALLVSISRKVPLPLQPETFPPPATSSLPHRSCYACNTNHVVVADAQKPNLKELQSTAVNATQLGSDINEKAKGNVVTDKRGSAESPLPSASKRKRKRNSVKDLRFEDLDQLAKGSKRKERKKEFLKERKNKRKRVKEDNALDFPGRENIRFGEVVVAPLKLSLPKVSKTSTMDASKERLRLQAVELYRKSRGWESRPGIKL